MICTDTADRYHWGSGCKGWHLVNSTSLSVIQELVPAGKGEQRHYHEEAEQFFYILKGQACFELDGNIQYLGEQQGIHVPAGTAHLLRNLTAQELHFLVVSTPPSHGDRVVSEP